MHAGQQLVDHLDRGALPRLVAQAVEAACDRLEHGLAAGEGFRPARGHHGHLPGGRLRRTARYRRVDQVQTQGVQPCAELLRELGRYGGAGDHHRAGQQLGRRSLLAEQHDLGLLRIDHHDHQRIDDRPERRRRLGAMTARVDHLLHRFRPHVAGVHLEARAQQRLGDAHSHRAQTDHTHPAHLVDHRPYSLSVRAAAVAGKRRCHDVPAEHWLP